ncbi:MFS transporter [Kordiimonas gwangyangensis]|uniref:MFS transporter n=1 Tax=Kordiimonas gwangyangensis TaxID=288022 RepID=UPI00037A92B6|nr:MFS transporter [Kordiimonas gwangyangensis]
MTTRRLPTAAPDGHIAPVLLAFLTTAGLFYVNIMPALVSGLVEGLGFDKATAGYVASANVYGASLGALITVFAVKYLNWKRAAFIALLGLIAVDMVSTLQSDGNTLIVLRFLHGSIGGFLVGIGFAVIARTPAPDRTFGMLLVVQYGLGGVGLMTLPKLVPLFGTGVLFIALIMFSAVTLLMLPFLAPYPVRGKTRMEAEKEGAGPYFKPLILALFAVFFFQSANMGLAAYVIELGKNFDLTTDSISTTLGFANWISVAGAVFVYVIGLRNGRWKPLLLGLALTVIGMAMFRFSANAAVFFAANVITGITWAFLIPYLLGMCAAFDGKGQMAALSGFFSKMGLASGPFVAALVIGEDNYMLLINLAIGGIVLCLAVAAMPARLLDRKDGQAGEAIPQSPQTAAEVTE